VRRLARQHGLDIDQVPGSGPGGRVRPQDVETLSLYLQSERPMGPGEAAIGGWSGNGDDPLSDLFARVKATLADEPLNYYATTLPQMIAQEVTSMVQADSVALLVDYGGGALGVLGGVGLTGQEQHAVVSQDHEAIRTVIDSKGRAFQDTDGLLASAAIPGSLTADAVVAAPIAHDSFWIGMLVVGRRSREGRRTGFDDREIGYLVELASVIGPTLQAVLLLQDLRTCLGTLEPPSGPHARRAAGSG
jgi:hypothetical protein